MASPASEVVQAEEEEVEAALLHQGLSNPFEAEDAVV